MHNSRHLMKVSLFMVSYFFTICTESFATHSYTNALFYISGVGRVNAMTFGAISASGFISLAIMSSTQLTLVQLSLPSPSLSKLNSAKLLLTGCHSTNSLGAASMLVSLGSDENNVDAESFAIVCRPKSSDFAYTPAPQMQSKIHGDTQDAFIQRATAITNNSNSFSSPTLSGRKLVEVTSSTDEDTLIQETVSATVKELQKVPKSPMDEGLRVEEEASKVITPEKKFVDMTMERSAATELKVLADASVSFLSPLMGLTLAGGDITREESTSMTSLLQIQTQTPFVGRVASPGDVPPDQTSHMILARVEYVGDESQIKITPVAMPFPSQMTRLDVISLQPLTARSSDFVLSPTSQGHITMNDLMFSPSPIKMMSPVAIGSSHGVPSLSVVCKSNSSQQFYCFLLSARDGKMLSVEAKVHFDLTWILAQSCPLPIESLSVKGIAIKEASTKMEGGRLECSNRIRLVLSSKNADESNKCTVSSPKPINLSLQEDCAVFLVDLSCTIPLGNVRVNKPLETPALDGRIVSHEQHESAIEGTRQAILDKLSNFEKEVYRRLDIMETAVRENTERVKEVEAALMKGSIHDEASF